MDTLTKVETLINSTMQKVAQAAAARDLSTLTLLTRRATELESMKRTLQAFEKKLAEMDEPNVAPSGSTNGSQLRQLLVEVTQGMINQNLLTLTDHLKAGRVHGGELLVIECQPSGARFKTDIVPNGNKLRERGEIARFYRDAGVKSGDIVVLVESEKGRWILRKANPGEFKTRMELALAALE